MRIKQKKIGDEKWDSKAPSFFAMLAVVIYCFGLFEVNFLCCRVTEKEMGVRKVLGASVISV